MAPLIRYLPTLLDCALIVSDCTVLHPSSGTAGASPGVATATLSRLAGGGSVSRRARPKPPLPN